MVKIEAIRFTLPQLMVVVKVNHANKSQFYGVLLSSPFETVTLPFT